MIYLFWPWIVLGLFERVLRESSNVVDDISIRCNECRQANAERDRRFLRAV